MAPHSSTLAWKIPWMEEPGRLQSMRSLESDMTEQLHFHFSLSCIGEGNGKPLHCSCLENPRDRGAWWAAVYGVTQSWTRLKWLSSSSYPLHWVCGDALCFPHPFKSRLGGSRSKESSSPRKRLTVSVCMSVRVCVCVCVCVRVCARVHCGGRRQLLEPTVGKANQSHPGVNSPLESTTNPCVQYNTLQHIWLFN